MNRQNKRSSMIGIYLFFLVLLTVSPLLQLPTPVSAAIDWSDDFNDGNYDGWTISGSYVPLDTDWVGTAGKADIVNGELWTTGTQIFRNFTYAIHESTVAFGSWSIDVNVRPIFNSSNHTHFHFLEGRTQDEIISRNNNDPNNQRPIGYDVMIWSARWSFEPPEWMRAAHDTAPSFLLMRRPGPVIIGSYSVAEINGLYHLNITRDETNRIKVYINDTLRIDVVDNKIVEPRSAYLYSESGIGFDNIVVREDVEPTGDDLLVPIIAVGGAGAVIIVAALVIWKRRQTG